MKKHRFFASTVMALLLTYGIFNFCTWYLFTLPLLDDPNCAGGDLTRMGYIPGSKVCRENVNDLPARHLELSEYRNQQIDVITIGDSFSNGGGGGPNPYYQDFLASLNGLTVLNLPQYKKLDKIATISILNNNGYLDRIKPKYLIIQCAEKQCFNDFPDRLDFSATLSDKQLQDYETVNYYPKPESRKSKLIHLDFFSEANYKLVKNSLCYRFSDNAFGSQVYKTKLDRPLFNVKEPDTLLFLKTDIKGRQKFSAANIAKLNDYLNTLSDRLARKGIRLYYMPCVDKYNLYSEFLVRNPYPKSPFFEQLRELPRRYTLIDTKAILLEELRKGEKDVYYADDTHWSCKASKKVFETVRFK